MNEIKRYRPGIFNHFDSQKYLFRVFKFWYFVLAGLIIGFAVSYINIRYTKRIYRTNAQIISKKWEEKGSPLSNIIEEDLLVQTPDIYQEIALINAEQNVADAIDRMDLNVSYYRIGRYLEQDVYPQKPIVVDFIPNENTPYGVRFKVELQGDTYTLSSPDETWNQRLKSKTFTLGKPADVNGFTFTVTRGEYLPGENTFDFEINNRNRLVGQFRGRISVDWFKQGSALINLSMAGPVPERDRDFLTHFIEVVIKNNIEDKNQYATNTLLFINTQLEAITDTLSSFDSNIDQFKLENREFIKGSEFIFTEIEELNEAKVRLQLANRYFDYLESYVRRKRDDRIFAPNLIGINAPLLGRLIDEYLEIKIAEENPLNENNSENPILSTRERRKEQIELTIFENLDNLRASNQDSLSSINKKIRFMMTSVNAYQSASREVAKLERLYSLNDKIYNLLLEKRVEVSIARASTTSDYELVNTPSINYRPISPDTRKSYITGALIGLSIPMAILLLGMLFNRRVVTKDDVEDYVDLPIIGIVGRGHPETGLSFFENPKSPIAESFRGLRSNLNFYLNQTKDKCKVILVTSSIGGEGKTYTALNLSYYYALSGARTLLIGADMRKPTIHKLLQIEAPTGLSDYLSGNATLEESILKIEDTTLEVLTSGSIPPNPAELLMNPKMQDLVVRLKQEYDYVIFDSPPFGLVSDTRELVKFADINLVLVRQSFTTKDTLYSIKEFQEESSIERIALVFNYVSFRKLNYGYGYGYGKGGYGYRYGYGYLYGYQQTESKKWWQKVFPRKK